MQPPPVDSADRDTENAVGVPIEIALILRTSPIARRKDKHAPLSIPALLHAIHHGLEDEALGRFHRLAVVWRSPRTRVNVVFLILVVERGGFVCVGNGSGQDPHAGYFGAVRDTDTAHVIGDRSDFACAPGTVLIVRQAGQGELGVVVKVI